MNKLFKVASSILTLATVIQAIAMAYVLGFEHGVNSQQPHIQELYRELHPDLGRWITFDTWSHPLRNALFGTSIILALCWVFVLLSILQKRYSKPKQP